MHSRFGNSPRDRRLPPPRLVRPPVMAPPKPSTPDMVTYPKESFAPIELAPEIRQHLKPVKYDGESPMQGRVNTIEGWDSWDMGQRLKFLREFVKDTARDPAIAAKTAAIIRSTGKSSREHQAQWAALLKYVQRTILYVNEPNERIQSAQYTLTERHGDCLPDTTVLLCDSGPKAIKNVTPGERIWGLGRWSAVEAVVDKGVLVVDEIRLANGSFFRATTGHKVYLSTPHGLNRIAVADVTPGMFLASPAKPTGVEVTEVRRRVATVPCYDIQTDDHYVYLPAADVTVSNCDDLAICLATLGESVRLPWRFVISGRSTKGERVRYVEGTGPVPRDVVWSHIYLCVGWPPFQPSKWTFAEPTLDVPLGWDTIAGRKTEGRADMAGRELAGSFLAASAPDSKAAEAALKEAEQEESLFVKVQKNIPWWNVIGTVLATVTTAVIVKSVVEPRLARSSAPKKNPKKRKAR